MTNLNEWNPTDMRSVMLHEIARRSISGALVYAVVVGIVWLLTDYAAAFPSLPGAAAIVLFLLGSIRIWASRTILRGNEPAFVPTVFYAVTAASIFVWGLFSGVTAFYYLDGPKGLIVMSSSAALIAGVATSLAPDRRLAIAGIGLIAAPTIGGAFLRADKTAVAFALLSSIYAVFLVLQTHMNWTSFWLGAQAQESEKARLRAEGSAAAKARGIATLSHEIRTPMNGIIGTAELLESEPASPVVREGIDTIKQCSVALLGLLNDVIDLARMEAGQLNIQSEPFSPGKCIQSAAALFQPRADQKGLDLSVEVDASVPGMLLGDSHRIRQIACNLISNAVKFTERGKISVRVRYQDQTDLVVEVQDTGAGIAESDQKKLFKAFEQLRAGDDANGAGLGLNVSRELARAMGGDLFVRSKLGEGASFWFRLPAAPAQFTAPAQDLPPAEFDANCLAGWRILVVNDSKVNQQVTSSLLRSAGAHVETAGGGTSGVALFESGAFDVVFMDCVMPDIDGLQASREIRRIERTRRSGPLRARIVALTASAQELNRQACEEAGMDSFLAKPVQRRELIAAVLTTGHHPPRATGASA